MTPREIYQNARLFLTNRRRAYRRLFDRGDMDAQIVLADLARFCRANETTVVPDARGGVMATAVLEGRREVWLRIQQHLQLSDEDHWRLSGGSPEPKGTSE